jgi:hypothetical protein
VLPMAIALVRLHTAEHECHGLCESLAREELCREGLSGVGMTQAVRFIRTRSSACALRPAASCALRM